MVDSVSQLEKYDAIAADLPYLKAIVLYGSESINRDMNGSVKIYHFDQFIQLGTEISDVLLKQRTESWKPGETCELVYTVSSLLVRKVVLGYESVIVLTPSHAAKRVELRGRPNRS